jgi:hypothetical protein
MSEKKRDSFTNPPALRRTYPSKPPPPQSPDYGSYQMDAVREKSVRRAEEINAGPITKMRETCAKLDEILTDLKAHAEAKRGISIVTSQEIYIGNVVELVRTLSHIINKIGFILNIFSVPYAEISRNGLPEHNPENTERVRATLKIAINQLRLLSLDPKKAKEDLGTLSPDNELIEKLERLNRTRGSFETRRAGEIVDIMKTLEEYLNSVIQAVKIGVAFNVETTRAELEQYEEIAGLTAVQLDEDEIVGPPNEEELRMHWHRLFYEIEFTLANFAVKIMEIYRPMGVWTLEKIEVRALQNFTRQMEQKVADLERTTQETAAAAQREPGLIERVKNSIRPGTVQSRPSVTDIQKRRIELAEAKGMLESLRRILSIRIGIKDRK